MSSIREQIWRQHLTEMRLKIWEDGKYVREVRLVMDEADNFLEVRFTC